MRSCYAIRICLEGDTPSRSRAATTGGYLLGPAIGLVPGAAPLVLLGTSTRHADPAHCARLVLVAVLCVVVPWMLKPDAIRPRPRASAAELPTMGT